MMDDTPIKRGKLLWRRREPSARMARPLLLRVPLKYSLLTALLVIAVVLPWFAASDVRALMLVIFVYICVMFGWIFVWSMDKPPMEVVEVYWNGAVAADWTGTTRFIPWGMFTGFQVKEEKGSRILVLDYLDETVVITDDVPGFESLAGEMRSKVNRPDRAFIDERMVRDRRRRFRHRVAFYVVLSFSVITSLLVLAYYRTPFLWPYHRGLFFTVAYIWSAMMMIPWFWLWLFDSNTLDRYLLERERMLWYSVLSGVLLYVSVAVVYYLLATSTSYTDYIPVDTTGPGDSALTPGEYVGETLRLSGPIVVHDGEVLRFVDSEIIFDPAPGNDYGIWVGEGGRLELVSTRVTSSNIEKGYRVQVAGSATITGCTFEGTCEDLSEWEMDTRKRRNDYPFVVASDDVLIENTTFLDALDTALVLRNCTARVEDCRFIRPRDAIYVLWGAPTIVNCTFTKCYMAVRTHNTRMTVEGCVFSECRWGVDLGGGNATVRDCYFEDINFTAIAVTAEEFNLEGNSFIEVGTDVYISSGSSPIFFWIGVVFLYVFPLMMLYFAWDRARKRKEEEWKEGAPRFLGFGPR